MSRLLLRCLVKTLKSAQRHLLYSTGKPVFTRRNDSTPDATSWLPPVRCRNLSRKLSSFFTHGTTNVYVYFNSSFYTNHRGVFFYRDHFKSCSFLLLGLPSKELHRQTDFVLNLYLRREKQCVGVMQGSGAWLRATQKHWALQCCRWMEDLLGFFSLSGLKWRVWGVWTGGWTKEAKYRRHFVKLWEDSCSSQSHDTIITVCIMS